MADEAKKELLHSGMEYTEFYYYCKAARELMEGSGEIVNEIKRAGGEADLNAMRSGGMTRRKMYAVMRKYAHITHISDRISDDKLNQYHKHATDMTGSLNKIPTDEQIDTERHEYEETNHNKQAAAYEALQSTQEKYAAAKKEVRHARARVFGHGVGFVGACVLTLGAIALPAWGLSALATSALSVAWMSGIGILGLGATIGLGVLVVKGLGKLFGHIVGKIQKAREDRKTRKEARAKIKAELKTAEKEYHAANMKIANDLEAERSSYFKYPGHIIGLEDSLDDDMDRVIEERARQPIQEAEYANIFEEFAKDIKEHKSPDNDAALQAKAEGILRAKGAERMRDYEALTEDEKTALTTKWAEYKNGLTRGEVALSDEDYVRLPQEYFAEVKAAKTEPTWEGFKDYFKKIYNEVEYKPFELTDEVAAKFNPEFNRQHYRYEEEKAAEAEAARITEMKGKVAAFDAWYKGSHAGKTSFNKDELKAYFALEGDALDELWNNYKTVYGGTLEQEGEIVHREELSDEEALYVEFAREHDGEIREEDVRAFMEARHLDVTGERVTILVSKFVEFRSARVMRTMLSEFASKCREEGKDADIVDFEKFKAFAVSKDPAALTKFGEDKLKTEHKEFVKDEVETQINKALNDWKKYSKDDPTKYSKKEFEIYTKGVLPKERAEAAWAEMFNNFTDREKVISIILNSIPQPEADPVALQRNFTTYGAAAEEGTLSSKNAAALRRMLDTLEPKVKEAINVLAGSDTALKDRLTEISNGYIENLRTAIQRNLDRLNTEDLFNEFDAECDKRKRGSSRAPKWDKDKFNDFMDFIEAKHSEVEPASLLDMLDKFDAHVAARKAREEADKARKSGEKKTAKQTYKFIVEEFNKQPDEVKEKTLDGDYTELYNVGKWAFGRDLTDKEKVALAEEWDKKNPLREELDLSKIDLNALAKEYLDSVKDSKTAKATPTGFYAFFTTKYPTSRYNVSKLKVRGQLLGAYEAEVEARKTPYEKIRADFLKDIEARPTGVELSNSDLKTIFYTVCANHGVLDETLQDKFWSDFNSRDYEAVIKDREAAKHDLENASRRQTEKDKVVMPKAPDLADAKTIYENKDKEFLNRLSTDLGVPQELLSIDRLNTADVNEVTARSVQIKTLRSRLKKKDADYGRYLDNMIETLEEMRKIKAGEVAAEDIATEEMKPAEEPKPSASDNAKKVVEDYKERASHDLDAKGPFSVLNDRIISTMQNPMTINSIIQKIDNLLSNPEVQSDEGYKQYITTVKSKYQGRLNTINEVMMALDSNKIPSTEDIEKLEDAALDSFIHNCQMAEADDLSEEAKEIMNKLKQTAEKVKASRKSDEKTDE